MAYQLHSKTGVFIEKEVKPYHVYPPLLEQALINFFNSHHQSFFRKGTKVTDYSSIALVNMMRELANINKRFSKKFVFNGVDIDGCMMISDNGKDVLFPYVFPRQVLFEKCLSVCWTTKMVNRAERAFYDYD